MTTGSPDPTLFDDETPIIDYQDMMRGRVLQILGVDTWVRYVVGYMHGLGHDEFVISHLLDPEFAPADDLGILVIHDEEQLNTILGKLT